MTKLSNNKTDRENQQAMSSVNRDSVTEKVAFSLQKRQAKEKRFRFIGLMAVALGFMFVVILLGDIFFKATPAFHQHWVKVKVEFDQDWLNVSSAHADELATANYRKVLKNSFYKMFPEVSGRKTKRDLFKLLSTDSEFVLKRTLNQTPELLNTQVALWLQFDDDVDSYLKEELADGVEGARINAVQAGWISQLKLSDRIEKRWNTEFFTNGDSREPELAGVRGALSGTLLTMLVTLVLSFPLGVAAALYLEEFAPQNRWTDIIEVNINNLAAVPSIVFGLLGLAVIINLFGLPRSAPLVGGIVLTLMTLPTIIIASRASIKAVPPSIREAALGLGASRTQVAFGHVLPLAMPGIMTGTIIGLAQALGETAPLLMIGMVAFIVDVPIYVTDAATVLPVQIYLWADSPERAFLAKTSAAILVLLGFLMLINLTATLIRKKFEKKW
jgi:phosphate transport system permease protein